MGNKEWVPSNVFDIFGDELARQILVLASERPLSADELADDLEVSTPTIYRRTTALEEYDLVTEHRRIDDDGYHFKTFETALEHVTFEVDEEGYDVDVQMRRGLVDQFESFWSDLDDSTPSGDRDRTGHASNDGSTDDIHHG